MAVIRLSGPVSSVPLVSFFLLLIFLCALRLADSQFGNHNPFRNRGYFDEDQHDYPHDDEPSTHNQQKAVNPCNPKFHRIIKNQPQRSYNYRFGATNRREHALCDRDINPGWYRFDSLAGNTIPTSCPGVNYCGTRAPVWMKGTIPKESEGIVEAIGCVSVQGKCCTTQIKMLVRNCSDFIVYHLQPTPACPSAYCAGYEVPCPAGLSSDTGYTPCHFPVDLLETKVSHGLNKDNSQVQFFCDVTLGGHVVPESVALEIEWLVDDEVVQSETFGLLQQHKGLLKEDKWNIGQVLHCRARARHTSINTFTSAVLSPPFNTGILIVSPLQLTAHEGSDPVFIEFQPSVPITCPKKEKPKKKEKKKEKEEEEEAEEEECCVTFDITTRGPASPPRCASGTTYDLIVLNGCSLKVCADEWNVTQRIPVWAVNDGLVGGTAHAQELPTVLVDIRTGETGNPPRWQDIVLPSQEIQIQKGDVEEKCTTYGDSITTFDGLSYTNSLEGTFILYKHHTLPYEVQVNLRKCNQKSLCNCAVAIRFGEAMIAMDVCMTGKLKFWSFTADGSYVEPSKITHLPQIIRIDEGRTFQIQLPTGTRINIGHNLRSVSIQAAIPDLEQTEGLCSSFDRHRENDFAVFQGQTACPISPNVTVTACDDYVKAWRLATEQSLFTGAFSGDGQNVDDEAEDVLSPGQCSCSGNKKAKTVELRPKGKNGGRFSNYPYEDYQPEEAQEEEEKEKDKCHTLQCVDPRGDDVTVQLLELALDEDFASDDEGFGKHVAASVELRPVYSSPSNFPAHLVTPKKEWTDDDADVVCRGVIEGMPATKLCRDIAHINVEQHTKFCKNEIMHSKNTEFTTDILEQLRWECRDQVYHNLSLWEPQLGRQYGTPPIGIITSLCLNNCTGNGICDDGVCKCKKHFAGADCSVNVQEAPVIESLNHNGVCDIRHKPCGEIVAWGQKFANHDQIKCVFEVYRAASIRSVPVLAETLTTNGKLITFQSILCDVPELPIHDAKIASFYIPGEGLDKTRTLMRLSISYGSDSPPSNPMDYTIYDSLCWACDKPLTCEARPTQSCNVLTEPFNSGDPFGTSSFHSPNVEFSHSNIPLQYSPTDIAGYSPQQPNPATITPHPGSQSAQVRHPQTHPQFNSPCYHTKDIGPCRMDVLRYFFDSETKKCRPFIYGGCGGNQNNFLSEEDCLNACTSKSNPLEKPSIVNPQAESSSSHMSVADSSGSGENVSLPEKCRLGNDPGTCDKEQVRYYYDSVFSKCRPFIFKGCGGNENNFIAKSTCEEECEAL